MRLFLSMALAFAPSWSAAQVAGRAAPSGTSILLPAGAGLGAGASPLPAPTATLAPSLSVSFSAPSVAAPAIVAPVAGPVEVKTQLVLAGERLSAAAKGEGKASALESVFTGGRAPSSGAAGDAVTTPGTDEIVHRLWTLARRSKSKRVRIGAIVVDRDGAVIGEGWNRQSTKAERRLMRVGIILHAEQGAMAQAWRKTKGRLEGARVYAMGISKDARSYVQKIEPTWACETCARSMERFRVSAMSSSAHGFKEFPWNEVLALAKGNAGHRWWQSTHKEDPNVTWRPIADVLKRLGR